MAGSRGRGPTLVKDINRKLVYSLLKERMKSTRAELAVLLGLNKNTVNTIVDELISGGYIRETGLQSRGGAGRKAIGIEFEAGQRKAIGLQLTSSAVLGVVTDLYANSIHSLERPVKDKRPEAVSELIAECVQELAAPYNADSLVGVGLGIPGLIDASGERVLGSTHMGWRDVAILPMLQQHIKQRILIDNSVKLASLGELWHGKASGAKNLAYCSFGTGVGCSLIIGGEIVRGEYGAAGELGHTVVEPEGPCCSCGNIGCLEAVVGLPAIYERLATKLEIAVSEMNEHWLIQQAEQGNETVLEEFRRVGKAIGHALSSAVNLLNPKVLICDGPLMKASALLFPIMEEELSRKTISFIGNKAELAVSALYPWTGSIGAAASIIGLWERQADPLEPITF